MNKTKHKPLPPRLRKFLKIFAAGGTTVQDAIVEAGYATRHVHNYWFRMSADYRKRFRRAHRMAGYVKQEVLDRLATVGYPKFHEGRAVFEYFDQAGNHCLPDEVYHVDAKGKPCDADAPGAVARKVAVRRERVYEPNITALIMSLRAAFPNRYRDRREVRHTGRIRTNPLNEQVRQILEDPKSTELANALARRMAQHAGGDGQSAN